MAYESRPVRRQRVLYNSANATNPLVYQLVVDGAKVTPSSAAITIYRPTSTTALVSAAAMTVSGSKMTYSCTTTTVASWPIDTGYRADIAVTYATAVYPRQITFDVVKYLFDLNIGKDQLVAFDDSIQGMQHISDEDFSELIESCYGQIQTRIEAKVIEDKKLLCNMILDTPKVANVAMLFILSRIHFNKGDMERYREYKTDFNELIESVLSTIQYDDDQDGMEAQKIGGLTEVRLVT